MSNKLEIKFGGPEMAQYRSKKGSIIISEVAVVFALESLKFLDDRRK